ncbi:helicase 2 [Homarus gammarus nudivirus]|uniref:Helicase 2 n=1 Tax=Homarus gammarus nudivirus TaxID=2509616 RepID=A0A411HBB5_9VIRU|nr:helicase 2 [Homarus gammarus nudivirus]QBB28674.1 helicase 2 [Homarus gammarus nudivirus]
MNEQDCTEYNHLYNESFAPPNYKILENTEKSKLALSVLNNDQRQVVYYIFEILSCSFNISGALVDPQIILLDAPSGTGKSFLIDCLATCVRNTRIVVIAKTRTLLNSICNTQNVNTTPMTTCKFTMSQFGLDFESAIKVFNNCYDSIVDVENFINTTIKGRKAWDFDLLIVDEYSMESPLLLAILLIIAKIERVNILILGDIKQQNTLTTSKFHKDNNYKLINTLPVHNHKLNEQMRIKDKELNSIISGIKSFIGDDTISNVKNSFRLKYYIFTMLQDKFFNCGKLLEDIYLTDTHNNIKNRIRRLAQYIKNRDIHYVFQRYEFIDPATQEIGVLALPDTDKYLPSLLLVEGCYYLYNKQIVMLKKIHHEHLEIELKSKTIQIVNKCVWTKSKHECVDDNYKWMVSHLPDEAMSILQFPIRPLCFTYYFVQGLTFDNTHIVVDLDSSLANSLYVGLSRVKSSMQISAIETKDLIGLLFTQYMNDDFLYKIPKPKPELIEHLDKARKDKYYKFDTTVYKFREVSPALFERTSSNYTKTKRDLNSVKNQQESPSINKKRKVENSELSLLLRKYYDNVPDVET